MTAVLANPEPLFHLVSSVVLLAAVGILVHLRPKVGIALFLAATALSTDLRDPVFAPRVSAAGLQIGPLDALAAVMLASAAARAVVGRLRGPHVAAVVVLTGLLFVNIVRGIATVGMQLTVNEARPWIYLIAAVTFCAVAPIRDPRWWTAVAFVYCTWLLLRSSMAFAVSGVQQATSYIEIDGQLADPRPVTAAAAAVLAQVILFILAARTRRGRGLVAVVVLGGALILLQHRTVWFAAIGGLTYLAFGALREGGRQRLAAVVASGGTVLAVSLALLSGTVESSAVVLSAENITASDNTFAWRVTGWQELLQQQTTSVSALIGNPFGGGFRRLVGGEVVDVSPHSHYLETFLRFGVLGLAASIVLLVLAWRGAIVFGPASRAVRSALVVIVIFGITYRWSPIYGVLLGTVLGLSAAGRPSELVAPTAVMRHVDAA
jgi:hypothetical protein